MKAVFVELPAFARRRADYLGDEAFGQLQRELMRNPEAGDSIKETGGLRKMRFADRRRGKGKRSGLRVIYYWWGVGGQFCYIRCTTRTNDLTPKQRKALKDMLKVELEARRAT